MPFADISRFISGLIEILRHRLDRLRQRHPVPVAAALRRIHARLQTGARRSADRLAGVGVLKLDALLRKLHQIGRHLLVDGIPALLVAEIKDDIRSHTAPPEDVIKAVTAL
jgi:hypothetical protein